MTAPDHDESKPRRRWTTYLAIGLVLVFVVYPLSIGPAAVIAVRFQSMPVYSAVYYPLGSAVDAVGADGVLIQYCEWCMKITNTNYP
jgi:hypothetical protein